MTNKKKNEITRIIFRISEKLYRKQINKNNEVHSSIE